VTTMLGIGAKMIGLVTMRLVYGSDGWKEWLY